MASGNQAGVPYKLTTSAKGADVNASQVNVSGFANYSRAVAARQAERSVDYTKEPLTNDLGKLPEIGAQLGRIGAFVEGLYECVPQDIEGALVQTPEGGYRAVLVQTRA